MLPSSRLYYVAGESSLGWLAVAMNDQDLICNVCLGDTREQVEEELQTRRASELLVASRSSLLQDAVRQLAALIDDPSTHFQSRTVLVGTDKQKEVWRAIQGIPMGSTITYAELASNIGVGSSSRAVAQACAANPLALLVPCHRVVKGDGTLSGYRWGEARKKELLDTERTTVERRATTDRPQSSAFARDRAEVHVVPMSVIRRPMPSELDESKVVSFMEEMQNGDVFTPVEIVKVKARLKRDPTGIVHNFYFSLGGCHRYEATRRLGLPTIRARIIEAPASQLRVYLGAGSPF